MSDGLQKAAPGRRSRLCLDDEMSRRPHRPLACLPAGVREPKGSGTGPAGPEMSRAKVQNSLGTRKHLIHVTERLGARPISGAHHQLVRAESARGPL